MKRPLVNASNIATAAGVLIAGFLGYVFSVLFRIYVVMCASVRCRLGYGSED